MRAGPRAVAVALVVLTGCTGGGGTREGAPTTAPAVTSIAPPTAVPTAPTTVVPSTTTALPADSVSLRVTGFTLPDLRSGGTGLRLLVQAMSPRVTVSRRGAGGAVSACPVDGAGSPPAAARDCLDLPAGGNVELPASGGVELRAAGAGAEVQEVTVTFVAATRVTTLVTPARPAGACATKACELTLSFLPPRPGPFVLDGRAGGGQPRFVLTAVPAATATGSNRVLATVQGGGPLSIRASLDPDSVATLLHHQQDSGPLAAVTAEILWP